PRKMNSLSSPGLYRTVRDGGDSEVISSYRIAPPDCRVRVRGDGPPGYDLSPEAPHMSVFNQTVQVASESSWITPFVLHVWLTFQRCLTIVQCIVSHRLFPPRTALTQTDGCYGDCAPPWVGVTRGRWARRDGANQRGAWARYGGLRMALKVSFCE